MTFFKHSWTLLLGGAVLLSACGASGDNPGLEYSPQMYHSVPYEPLSQITDEDAGMWLTVTEDKEVGEFYNSNPHNPHGMTMREPVANTVKRNDGYLPYRLEKDDLETAASQVSPLDSADESVIADGKALYITYCSACHGAKGQGDGLVSEKYLGVANLTTPAYANITEGHIFHVITHGKGLMQPHGTQVNQEERWKIARFVKQVLQK